jgi:hypothetical protein
VSEPIPVGKSLADLEARLSAVRARAVAAGRVPTPLYRCLTCCDTGFEDLGECVTEAGNVARRGLRRCPAGCVPGVREERAVPASQHDEAVF